jgi:toxin ParE1/3/4
MKRRLIVQPAAETDINDAVDWYENRRSGSGDELLAEIRRTLERIEDLPESFPFDFERARRARTSIFPYKMYFVLTDELISVIALLHDKQDKQKLKKRL